MSHQHRFPLYIDSQNRQFILVNDPDRAGKERKYIFFPQIAEFSVSENSSNNIDVYIRSNLELGDKLDDIEVIVSGKVLDTLDRLDFSESSLNKFYEYSATYPISVSGEYIFTLNKAKNELGNNGAKQQKDSIVINIGSGTTDTMLDFTVTENAVNDAAIL